MLIGFDDCLPSKHMMVLGIRKEQKTICYHSLSDCVSQATKHEGGRCYDLY